jgi:gas vesicle protein
MAHRDDDTPYIVIERRSGGFGGLLLGILIGAGLGILFAPRSGEETRAELRSGMRRFRKQAEDTMQTVQDSVADTFDAVRQNVTERVEAARDAFDAGRQAARETREEMERRVREARARARAGIQAARRPPASHSLGGGAPGADSSATESGLGD